MTLVHILFVYNEEFKWGIDDIGRGHLVGLKRLLANQLKVKSAL